MKSKRIFAFLFASLLLIATSLPAFAAQPIEKYIDLDNGLFVIRTISQTPSPRSGNTVYGQVSDKVYQGETQIGSATLYASFDISGSTAVAQTAILQGSGLNGWTYSNGGTAVAGNRATAVAFFQISSTLKQLPLALSCTPDGTLYGSASP